MGAADAARFGETQVTSRVPRAEPDRLGHTRTASPDASWRRSGASFHHRESPAFEPYDPPEDIVPEPSVAESSEEGAGAMRVFDSPLAPADSAARAQLERGVRGIDLAAAPVILPDFHHKQDLEMPSSIAVATRETIHPIFTSSSVNCGMALIALNHD